MSEQGCIKFVVLGEDEDLLKRLLQVTSYFVHQQRNQDKRGAKYQWDDGDLNSKQIRNRRVSIAIQPRKTEAAAPEVVEAEQKGVMFVLGENEKLVQPSQKTSRQADSHNRKSRTKGRKKSFEDKLSYVQVELPE